MLGAIAMLLSMLAVALGGVASADTNGSPDTVTKAAFAPTAGSAGAAAPATLAGAVAGETVNMHVDSGTAGSGKFFNAEAHLCKPGFNAFTSSQLAPSQGNCLPNPLPGAANDVFVSSDSDPTNTFTDFSFRVGSGSETFTANSGSVTITCDSTHPCAIWLDESVSNTVDPSLHVFKHYDVTYVGTPGAPGVASAPGNGSLTITLTPPSNAGNSAAPLSYSVTVNGPGGTIKSGTGTSYNFTGLTNFNAYTVTATATSTAADGSTLTSSNGQAGPDATTTPVPSPPTNVQGTPADSAVALTWQAPAGPTPVSYDVLATPAPLSGANPRNNGSSATSFTFTNLNNGTVYTFTVRAVYSGGSTGQYSAPSGPITPQGKFLTQTITVTRPQGDLVLTQLCGAQGANESGAAPTLGAAPGGQPDPLATQYPYPTDPNTGLATANYPTNCGIALGKAVLKTSQPFRGDFFVAVGNLNQVTVVDTRDSDPGFTVNGQMTQFTDNAGHHFSGSQLGWSPVVSKTSDPFTDSDGNTYTQTVTKGPDVAPNTPNASGLSTGDTLASAARRPANCTTPCTGGVGIAKLDALLTLWIPVTAHAGDYTATMTISAI